MKSACCVEAIKKFGCCDNGSPACRGGQAKGKWITRRCARRILPTVHNRSVANQSSFLRCSVLRKNENQLVETRELLECERLNQ